jgi:hypothetical protein
MQPQNRNCNKLCSLFHQQLCFIDEWGVAGMATHMFNEDQISGFLKTIPKDCKIRNMAFTNDIIEGVKSWLPSLVGNVIPHLSLSIETKEHSASAAKCTIINASSSLQKVFQKHCQMGRPSHSMTWKCCLISGKVVDL